MVVAHNYIPTNAIHVQNNLTTINIINWNCRGIYSVDKYTQLHLVSHTPIHIYALTETHLYSQTHNMHIKHICPYKYTCHSLPSSQPRCGGLMFLVHSTIPSNVISSLTYQSPECSSACFTIKVRYSTQRPSHTLHQQPTILYTDILMMVVYKHPQCSASVQQQLYDAITKAVAMANTLNIQIIVCGDFNANANHIVHTQSLTNKLSNTLYNINNIYIPDVPTHTQGGALDLSFTNTLHNIKSLTVARHLQLISDHYPTLLTLNTTFTLPSSTPMNKTQHKYTGGNISGIYTHRWNTHNVSDDTWTKYKHASDTALQGWIKMYDSCIQHISTTHTYVATAQREINKLTAALIAHLHDSALISNIHTQNPNHTDKDFYNIPSIRAAH